MKMSTTKKVPKLEPIENEEISPKKRRERSENWSEQEKITLIGLIKAYGKPILDKTAEKKDKDLAWTQIYQGMRMQGSTREKSKLKDMWKRMKMLAKANNYNKKLTDLDLQVADLVPDVLIIDANANQKYISHNIMNHDSLTSINHDHDDRSASPASIQEDNNRQNDSLYHESIVQNNIPFEHLRVTPDIEERSIDMNDERIRQQIRHEDALFKLKYEHVQKLYKLELEHTKQKHLIEMEILQDVKEKLKNSNVNLLEVINCLK